MTYFIEFNNGSNTYICFNENKLNEWRQNWILEQIGETSFCAYEKPHITGKTYSIRKSAARNAAIDWQNDIAIEDRSYSYFTAWGDYFEEIGRKYGLLREFRENGIL